MHNIANKSRNIRKDRMMLGGAGSCESRVTAFKKRDDRGRMER
jgi:hypothetical protein